MAKLIELIRHRFCWHHWLPWSDPFATYNTGHKQQWRVCRHCNKAEFRTLAWDKQIAVPQVVQAVKQSRAAIPASNKEQA